MVGHIFPYYRQRQFPSGACVTLPDYITSTAGSLNAKKNPSAGRLRATSFGLGTFRTPSRPTARAALQRGN